MSLKASVVVPTHNRPDTLKNLLLSLNGQTLPSSDFEIVVVDNGSDAETGKVVENLSINPRVAYIVESVRGAARARNQGIERARGEIIIFVDDDMTVEKNFVAAHLRAHSQFDKDMCILGKITHRPRRPEKIISRYLSQSVHQNISLSDEEDQELGYQFFYTANISVPKKALIGVGGFDESFPHYGWEDIDLGYKLQQRGIPIIYDPSAVGYHHFDTSLREYLKKRYRSGKSLGYLLSKHPDLRKNFHIANIPFPLALLKAAVAVFLLVPALLVLRLAEKPLFRTFDAFSNLMLCVGLRSSGTG